MKQKAIYLGYFIVAFSLTLLPLLLLNLSKAKGVF